MAARVLAADAHIGPDALTTVILCIAVVLALAVIFFGLGWWARGLRIADHTPAREPDPLPPPAALPAGPTPAPANYQRNWENALPRGYWDEREGDGWADWNKRRHSGDERRW